MNFRTKYLGEIYVFAELTLWSWFPIISLLSISTLNPVCASAWTSLCAAGFFYVVLLAKKSFPKSVSRETWKNIVVATLLTGVGYYALTFIAVGLTHTNNVALLLMLEIPFSIIILYGQVGEKLPNRQILGASLMCLGGAIVILPKDLVVSLGDLLIVLAAAIAPVGNFFQKRARKEVPAEYILFIRSLLAAGLLSCISLLVENRFSWPELNSEWLMVLINGLFLMGLSKIFWIEAIHRLPISKATAYASATPVLTLVWAYLCFGQVPTAQQLIGGLPLIIGMGLVSL